MGPLAVAIVSVLQPFACLFTQPTWRHAQVLLVGMPLAQGPRTVAAALRVMGLGAERRFERYHRVLNRARWSACRGAQILLGLLIERLQPAWPIVVAVDETLERRKGVRIGAKGMYRDAVRSTRRKVVTCLGLQCICLALLVPVSWSERPRALPFLSRLAPSERAEHATGRRHPTTVRICLSGEGQRRLQSSCARTGSRRPGRSTTSRRCERAVVSSAHAPCGSSWIHNLRKMHVARLFESLPPTFPNCGADKRMGAFINEAEPLPNWGTSAKLQPEYAFEQEAQWEPCPSRGSG
jgi:hypothetical protein